MTDTPAHDATPVLRSAWADGLATLTPDGAVLDAWFPSPALGEPPVGTPPDPSLLALERSDPRRGTQRAFVRVVIDVDDRTLLKRFVKHAVRLARYFPGIPRQAAVRG